MSIQYAGGTIVNATFTSDGTRCDLVSNLNTQLKNAGWTAVSGDGTGDVLMASATTPEGLSIRFRLYDPGSGNCAQFTMKNAAGTLTSAIAYMLPTNGKEFRIIACKYWFFMFSTGAANKTAPREICYGGVPCVADFLLSGLDASNGFFGWTGVSDTDTTARNNWRSRAHTSYSAGIWGGALTAMNNQTNMFMGSIGADNAVAPSIHPDGTGVKTDAYIMWGSAIRGRLWNALVLTTAQNGEGTFTYDGHTWMVITDQYGSNIKMTLCVAVS